MRADFCMYKKDAVFLESILKTLAAGNLHTYIRALLFVMSKSFKLEHNDSWKLFGLWLLRYKGHLQYICNKGIIDSELHTHNLHTFLFCEGPCRQIHSPVHLHRTWRKWCERRERRICDSPQSWRSWLVLGLEIRWPGRICTLRVCVPSRCYTRFVSVDTMSQWLVRRGRLKFTNWKPWAVLSVCVSQSLN